MANLLPTEKKAAIISMLCEGSSIRGIERITGVHRDTIMRLGVRVGQGCAEILDRKMRGLRIPQIQVDEMWGFIGAKAKTAKANDMKDAAGAIELVVPLPGFVKRRAEVKILNTIKELKARVEA